MSEQTQAPSPPPPTVPERFVPDEMRGQLVEAEHVARYRWAAAFCEGRTVLDAGCGTGYGAEMLHRAGADEVVGIDSSEAALELARAAVTAGVTCQLGDVSALAFPDASFDVVVCFEVIEHVADPERVFDELARVLRDGGVLLVSSPNRERYVPGNPHHRHEYTREELQAALDARFGSARIISQHVMLASVISWSGAPEFGNAHTERMVVPAAQDEIYLLAIAGSDLPPHPGPVVTLGAFDEPRRWLEYIDGQRRHIEDQMQLLEDLSGREADRQVALAQTADAQVRLARLSSQDAELEETRRELESARRELSETGEALAQTAGNLAEVRARAEAQEGELKQLRLIATSKSWQLTAPLRKAAALRRRS